MLSLLVGSFDKLGKIAKRLLRRNKTKMLHLLAPGRHDPRLNRPFMARS